MNHTQFDMQFEGLYKLPVVIKFDGCKVSSNAGVLLLAKADDALGLTQRLANSIKDDRQSGKVSHSMLEMVQERTFAVAAGYSDANDLDTLNRDPSLLTACGKSCAGNLASQPTISRLENSVSSRDLVFMAENIAAVVVEQLPRNSKCVIIDVDATDDPCHGQQEFKFFNGYYDNHCYLPFYVHITGSDNIQRLVASVLRPGNAGPDKGLFSALRQIITLLRTPFPNLRIILRADGAYGHKSVIEFCETYGLEFSLGYRSNKPLAKLTLNAAKRVEASYDATKIDAKEYVSFLYKAENWKSSCRVVAKVETVNGSLNIRYILTSNAYRNPANLYRFYSKRGEQENRIKEMKLDLNSGRTSCSSFLANQFRLLLHTAACVILRKIQDGLRGTTWSQKQISSIQLALLRVGAKVVTTTRNIQFHLPDTYLHHDLWLTLNRSLT